MKKPPFLHEGDRIRLISPAGVIDSNTVDDAALCLEKWGLSVIKGDFATARDGRFAGKTENRLSDLQTALDDPDCKAILCNRGGYGTIQLMDQIDMTSFREHPKWVIGYSDITMLHALMQIEGRASIHGGMAKALAGQIHPTDNHEKEPALLLHDILFGQMPEYRISTHPLNRLGEASGNLAGGNLSILYSLRGTPFDHIPIGSILFIEDIGEKPYEIDRMMYNLKLGGILSKISGLIVGQFTDFEEDPLFGKTVYEIIANAVAEYDYPVCFHFPAGHVEHNLPLVFGTEIQLLVGKDQVSLCWPIQS
jgi:muramoyltetrapeptide carboxypeptidase